MLDVGQVFLLISIKKGFNIIGYDKAPGMVKEAKNNLIKYKMKDTLVFKDDLKNPKHKR